MSEPNKLQTTIAVAIGGIIGATVRWAIGTQLAPDGTDGFPLDVLVVNVTGCMLIGVTA
ncbi:MAG: fluoride efflux transporter CrcB, partial [Ilumatobacter sp.]|nr:fluoride efflux transporter CrcB [Ilumatobacter sp.]